MSFFGKKTTGLKADIKRHRQQEKELLRLISEAEQAGNAQHIRVYRNFLNKLIESKADVVSKIGKKF